MNEIAELSVANVSAGSIFCGLQTLDLKGNKLLSLPWEVLEMRSLNELDLSHNLISDSKDFLHLGQLKLKKVLLQGNPMFKTNAELREFEHNPQALISFIRMQVEVHLESRSLNEVPLHVLTSLQLRRLFLSHNFLLKLPDKLTNLTSLQTLHVDHNRLIFVEHWIAKLQSLSEINLSHNKLQNLPPSITSLPGLTSLDVSNNYILALPSSKQCWFGDRTSATTLCSWHVAAPVTSETLQVFPSTTCSCTKPEVSIRNPSARRREARGGKEVRKKRAEWGRRAEEARKDRMKGFGVGGGRGAGAGGARPSAMMRGVLACQSERRREGKEANPVVVVEEAAPGADAGLAASEIMIPVACLSPGSCRCRRVSRRAAARAPHPPPARRQLVEGEGTRTLGARSTGALCSGQTMTSLPRAEKVSPD
eukprot:757007-Hanusia_phi.AAC.2